MVGSRDLHPLYIVLPSRQVLYYTLCYTMHLYCYVIHQLLLCRCYTIHPYCCVGATPAIPYISIATRVLHTPYISIATRVLHQLYHTSLLLHGCYIHHTSPLLHGCHTIHPYCYMYTYCRAEHFPTHHPRLIFYQTTI